MHKATPSTEHEALYTQRRRQLERWVSVHSVPHEERSYFSQLLSGKAPFGEKAVLRLERDYAMGKGYLDSESEPDDSVTFQVLDVRATCGAGAFNDDHPVIIRSLKMAPGQAKSLLGTQNRNGSIHVINADHDSMLPTIKPSDLLFVDVGVREYRGEGIYILLLAGHLVCKRLAFVGAGLSVLSDNTNYPPWSWDDRRDDTRILGKVIKALPLEFRSFGVFQDE